MTEGAGSGGRGGGPGEQGAARPPVAVLVTGGTLDKVHNWATEGLDFAAPNAPPAGGSHLPEILAEARCHFARIEVLFLKDSLEMDDADRDALAAAIAAAPEERLVITHGTSTLAETGKALAARGLGKTIVLTGAMRPFSLGRSDGPFNLGAAVMAAQLAPPGVYAAMNGRLFADREIRKNLSLGRFDV